MNKSLKWKTILLLFLIVFSGFTILPSFTKSLPQWWTKYLAPEGLRLGLDLQGGMHLVLKVDLEKAIENTLDLAAQDLKEELAGKSISLVRTPSTDPNRVLFTLPNIGSVATVQEIVTGDFPNLEIDVKAEEGSFPRIEVRLAPDQIEFINKNAVNQSLEIIRNRIDQFGVAEPVIVRQGKDEIVVQLPGVKDPQRALDLIGKTAQLEFKLVYEEGGVDLNGLINEARSAGEFLDGKYQGDDRRRLNSFLQNRLPVGTEIYFEKRTNNETKTESITPLLIKSPIMMTGDMVQDAQPQIGGTFNEPYVSLNLTGRGGKVFGEVTEKHVNKRFAIILDDIIKSAPVIRERILGGRAQISGSFTYEEASDLSIVLRVGALPAPVNIIQNLTVGASLGQDSINKGLMSGLLGTLLVMSFMIFYYRLSGVIANGALVLNILFLFAGLATMNATLTLPGIAGIILSIGMAVDSNVLIFERMREEFALGKSIKSGIDGGYDKAFWTIVDSQVTTLITSLALFLFGTGPIKGFAVTLSLGVSFNLLSTLFGTRLIYDILHQRKALKKLTFFEIFKKPSLDFMKIRKITFAVSGILVLIGLVAFVQILRGHANLGVDFAGGTMVQYKAETPFQLDEVRKLLHQSELDGAVPQEVENENRLIVKLKKDQSVVGDISETITRLLQDNMPDQHFELESQSEIGSSISSVLRDKAIEAIIISLLGVICYLALRFDLTFGLAATIATFHDVVVVLGICYLLDIEITLLIVTALLTLAGYSLNDTVVVFDRIRENLKKSGETLNMMEIINLSVNEVMSRSVVTSFTTALSLVALLTIGGVVIHDFSLALLIGIIVGTYSSVFIASPLLYLWRKA
ncbi:MAG: protein translocase subunit SecD [Proteobacteria bacterium]|nr:protein translocase subunit SecD [Pseudomonadota bacterium]MBU1687742.1 protein translocase subunit SecD [Pseudomonadota bacterium]